MTTKTVNQILTILKVSFVVTLISALSLIAYKLLFSESDNIHAIGNITILLLFVCIMVILYYFHFKSIKIYENNNTDNKKLKAK